MKTMICGANGNVANEVIKMLLKENLDLVITTSNINKIPSHLLNSNKVELKQLNYFDSNVEEIMFNDIENIFLVWPSNLLQYDTNFNNFLNKIFSSGVKHITFISAMGIENAKKSPYYIIEQLIKKSNKQYTFLRPNMYMQNLLTHHLDEILSNNELFIPAGNSKISYIDSFDVAKISSEVLLNYPKYANKELILTGSEAVTSQQIADIMTKTLNRTITYTKPTSRKWKKVMLQKNWDLEIIKELTSLYFIAKLGLMKKVDITAQTMLNNQLNTIETFIQRNITKFEN